MENPAIAGFFVVSYSGTGHSVSLLAKRNRPRRSMYTIWQNNHVMNTTKPQVHEFVFNVSFDIKIISRH